MYMTPEQLMAGHKASVEALTAMSHTAFGSFEKLMDLNIKVIKSTLEEATAKAQEASELKDVQEAMSFAVGAAQPAADKFMSYARDVHQILSTMNAEMARLTETQMAAHQQKAAELIELMSKNAPAGSESAVSLVKSSFSAATTAYDQMTKAAKQAAEVAETNLMSAANTAMKAASSAAETAKAATPRARKAA